MRYWGEEPCTQWKVKGNQNPMSESILLERVKWEEQFKTSFIKIGCKIRELWTFEKSCITFYGDPQIGKHASKWLILWTTLHLFCTQIFRFPPLFYIFLIISSWPWPWWHMWCELYFPMTYVVLSRRQDAILEIVGKIWKFVYKTNGELSTKSAILKHNCQFEDPHIRTTRFFKLL